ncbi:GNAT family N-acetyltransferase [Thalassobacillus hwangdonensis]|uniref:GNAT family N-acetyltransferase n=1 Tax=Thalassobacillus hwangdonensis TaxID=546108 RepID=A0ABW3L6H7_9BACI
MIIKPLRPEDAPVVQQLLQENVPEEIYTKTIYHLSGYVDYVTGILKQNESSNPLRYYGAYVEDDFAGFTEHYCKKGTGATHWNNLYLLDRYRADGIGKLLQQKTFDEAREDASHTLTLDVFDWNTGPLKWYRRLGASYESTNHWMTSSHPLLKKEKASYYLHNKLASDLFYEKYGFAELNLQTPTGDYRIGVLGDTYFRITDTAVFKDLHVFHALRELDPERELLFIVPYIDEDILDDIQFVATSYRLHVSL